MCDPSIFRHSKSSSSSSVSLFSFELRVNSFTKLVAPSPAIFLPQVGLRLLSYPVLFFDCVDDGVLELLRNEVDAEILALAVDEDLFRHNVDEAVTGTLVKFNVLDTSSHSSSVRYAFGSSKSCLFESSIQSLLESSSASNPLAVFVKDALPLDSEKRRTFGSGILDLNQLFAALEKRLGDDFSLPSSVGLKNSEIDISDSISGAKVGVVDLDVELVSYGDAGKLLLHHIDRNSRKSTTNHGTIRNESAERGGYDSNDNGDDIVDNAVTNCSEVQRRMERTRLNVGDDDRDDDDIKMIGSKKTVKILFPPKKDLTNHRDDDDDDDDYDDSFEKSSESDIIESEKDRRSDLIESEKGRRSDSSKILSTSSRGVQTDVNLVHSTPPLTSTNRHAFRTSAWNEATDRSELFSNPPVLYYNSQNEVFQPDSTPPWHDPARPSYRASQYNAEKSEGRKSRHQASRASSEWRTSTPNDARATALPPAEAVLRSLRKPRNMPVLRSLVRELLQFMENNSTSKDKFVVDAPRGSTSSKRENVADNLRTNAASSKEVETQTESVSQSEIAKENKDPENQAGVTSSKNRSRMTGPTHSKRWSFQRQCSKTALNEEKMRVRTSPKHTGATESDSPSPDPFSRQSFKPSQNPLQPHPHHPPAPLPKSKSWIRSTPPFKGKRTSSLTAASTNTLRLRMARRNPRAIEEDEIVVRRSDGKAHVRMKCGMRATPLQDGAKDKYDATLLPEKPVEFLYTGSSQESQTLQERLRRPDSRPGWTSDEEWNIYKENQRVSTEISAAPTPINVSVEANDQAPRPSDVDESTKVISFPRGSSMARFTAVDDEAVHGFANGRARNFDTAEKRADNIALKQAASQHHNLPEHGADSFDSSTNASQDGPAAGIDSAETPMVGVVPNFENLSTDDAELSAIGVAPPSAPANVSPSPEDAETDIVGVSKPPKFSGTRQSSEESQKKVDRSKNLRRSSTLERTAKISSAPSRQSSVDNSSKHSSPLESHASNKSKKLTATMGENVHNSAVASSESKPSTIVGSPLQPDATATSSEAVTPRDHLQVPSTRSDGDSVSSADGTSYPTVKHSPAGDLLTKAVSNRTEAKKEEERELSSSEMKKRPKKLKDDGSDSYSPDFSSHDTEGASKSQNRDRVSNRGDEKIGDGSDKGGREIEGSGAGNGGSGRGSDEKRKPRPSKNGSQSSSSAQSKSRQSSQRIDHKPEVASIEGQNPPSSTNVSSIRHANGTAVSVVGSISIPAPLPSSRSPVMKRQNSVNAKDGASGTLIGGGRAKETDGPTEEDADRKIKNNSEKMESKTKKNSKTREPSRNVNSSSSTSLPPLTPPPAPAKRALPPRQFSSDASSSQTPRDFHQLRRRRRNAEDYDDALTPNTPSSPPPWTTTTNRPLSRGEVVSTPTTTTTTSWEPSDDGEGISSGGSEFERDVAVELGMSGEGDVARRSRQGMESSFGGTSSSGGMSKLRMSNAKPAEGSKLGYTF